MTASHRLRLLGPITIECAQPNHSAALSRKAMALLGYVVRKAQPVTRSHLAELLWSETSAARGRRNLTRELSQLTSSFPGCFRVDYHTVHWAPSAATWVDITAFTSLLLSAPGAPPVPALVYRAAPPVWTGSDAWFARPGAADLHAADLAAAAALSQGEFMAGLYLDDCAEFETWLIQEREYWHQQIIWALDLLIAYHAMRREDEQAYTYIRRWMDLEPWQEDAHRYLMVLLGRNGKRNDALAQYEICRRILAAKLAREPTDETKVLCEQIRSGQLGREVRSQRGSTIDVA